MTTIQILQLVVPTLVTIAGLWLASNNIKKSFANEIRKTKQTISIKKMEEAIYIFTKYLRDVSRGNGINKELDTAYGMFLCYGSENIIKIVSYLQQRVYNAKTPQGEIINISDTIIACNLLIITCIKYEITSELIPTESYAKIYFPEFNKKKEGIKRDVNEIIDKLNLDNKFKIIYK